MNLRSERRLVFFGPGFTEIGGAQKRASLLAFGLARRDWRVTAINRAGTRRSVGWIREPGVRAVDVPGYHSPFIGALVYMLIGIPMGLFWGTRASVFVAMQVGSQTLLASICSAICRRPFVVLTTSNGPFGEIDILRKGGRGRLRRWAIRRAAIVVVQTDEAVEELKGLVKRQRIKVMPNPVKEVGVAPLNGAPRALFMGRLSEEKDLPRLLRVWKQSCSRREGARLTLLGRGGAYRSVESSLKEMTEADPILARSVTFAGWVDDPERYLVESDVFVFPSLSEGMSNSLLEACAAGRVVVASAIPANVAALGSDYPLLFPPGDEEAMVKILDAAFDEEGTRLMAVAQIRARLELFSVERVMDIFEGALRDAQDSAHHLDA